MKAFYFLALAMSISFLGFSQSDSIPPVDQPYYVVVGVFSIPKNAMLWARQMPKYQLKGKYEMNFNKGLNYVYVMKTNDRTQAIDEALTRLSEGTYGICAECGIEVSEKRLEAVPFAKLCVQCQSRQELLEKIEKEEDRD